MSSLTDRLRLSAYRHAAACTAVVAAVVVVGWATQMAGLSHGADSRNLGMLWTCWVAAWPLRAVWLWAASKIGEAAHGAA